MRLRKAAMWLPTYEGAHLVRAYRKKFKLDYTCAFNDLEALGALSPEKLVNLRHGEEIRQRKKQEEKEASREQEFSERWADSDDIFYFIAGYMSGGVPYGVTWEEMGLEPYETLESPVNRMDEESEINFTGNEILGGRHDYHS